MSAKFKLVPNPTFEHTVKIPRAGDEDAELQFTFKHHSLKDMKAIQNNFKDKLEKASKLKGEDKQEEAVRKLQLEFINALATGWEVEDEFCDENLNFMLDNYPRAFDAITTQYQAELWSIRQKR